MILSRRAASLLLLFGVWSWVIWLTFLKNIWADPRSWDHGATAFFLVHLVLVVVSVVLGTAIGWLGLRGLQRRQSQPSARPAPAGGDRESAKGRP